MKKAKEKKKQSPLPCVCGLAAATVCFKGKKMVSCPNPERCSLGPRTEWYKTTDAATERWNRIIIAANYKEGQHGNVPAHDPRQAAGTE